MDSDETGLGTLLRSKPPTNDVLMMAGGRDGVHRERSVGQPYFGQNETEAQPVTAQLGTEIALNCTVENLDDKTVSERFYVRVR
jgi:hypothetical protein